MDNEKVKFSADTGDTLEEMNKMIKKMKELEQQALSTANAFREQNKEMNDTTKNIKMFNRGSSKSSSSGSDNKSKKDKEKEDEKEKKNKKELAGWGSKASIVLGLVGLSFKKIANEAQKLNNTLYKSVKSLASVGTSLSKSDKEVLESSKAFDKFKNGVARDFKQFIKPVGDFFNNFYKGWVKADELLKNQDSVDLGKIFNGSDINSAKIKEVALKTYQDTNQSMEDTITKISEIALEFEKLGFSIQSSTNAATSIFDLGRKAFNEYGVDPSEAANNINKAINGSGTEAVGIGYNLSDDVLSGWLAATKGINTANTEMSEAIKTYYKYQLAQEQSMYTNRDMLQDQIKNWAEYGSQIKNTTNSLFAFDEATTMNNALFEIPEIGDIEADVKPFEEIEDSVKETKKDLDDIRKLPPIVLIDPKDMDAVKVRVDEFVNRIRQGVELQVGVTFVPRNSVDTSPVGNTSTSPVILSDPIYGTDVSKAGEAGYSLLDDIGNKIADGATAVENGLIKFNSWLESMGWGSDSHWSKDVKGYISENALRDALIAFGIPLTGGASIGVGDALKNFNLNSLPGFETGGIVTSPQIANIGEKYKNEAVIPLETELGKKTLNNLVDASGGDSNGSYVYNINIGQNGTIIGTRESLMQLSQTINDNINRIHRNTGGQSYGRL